LWLFGFSIGSFYNELSLAILYRVVDTCDDREPCSWEQNNCSRVQEVRFFVEPPSRRDDVGIILEESCVLLINSSIAGSIILLLIG